jgi:hypothetical protein
MPFTIEFKTTSLVYFYKIQNKLTKKCYVGRTSNPNRRFTEHISGKGSPLLLADVVENGIKFFSFEVLDCHKNDADLDEIEDGFINKYDALTPNGFNKKLNSLNPSSTDVDLSNIEVTGKYIGERGGIKTFTVGELSSGRGFRLFASILSQKPELADKIQLKKHFRFKYFEVSIDSDNDYIRNELSNLKLRILNRHIVDTSI